MRTTGHTHDTFTSVRPSRPCSQALEAKAELAAINESDCASSGFAMAGYVILTLEPAGSAPQYYDTASPHNSQAQTNIKQMQFARRPQQHTALTLTHSHK